MAAAVILHVPRLPVRIDDSKRLTAHQRAVAYAAILEQADIGVGIVPAAEIDRINILQATFMAMQYALERLPQRPDLVLVDGHLAPPIGLPCRPIIHGDQREYVISCASIVAKVVRDDLMGLYHELAPQYAFARHKGYGTSLHAANLKQHGPSIFHRRTFHPVLDE